MTDVSGNDRQIRLIAELGSVHDGSFGNAKRLIQVAADCGCAGVKFQAHMARFETTKEAPSPSHFQAESRYDYFERIEFAENQWRELVEAAHQEGIAFIASPFSLEALSLLERVGVDQVKIASGEVTNVPLLRRTAECGKPILLSSGMSNWEELDQAVKVLDGTDVTIMQCSSVYPCPPELVGLNVLQEMQARYGLPIGFSDHTQTLTAAIAAATFGATVIEKHLTFSRLMYGSDAPFATTPDEFRTLASSLAEVETMLWNKVDKDAIGRYEETRNVFLNSIVVNRDVEAGHVLQESDLTLRKPGTGISGLEIDDIVGRPINQDLLTGDQLSREDLG